MRIEGQITSVVQSRGWKGERLAIVNVQTEGSAVADMHIYVPRVHPLAKVMREGVTIQVGPAK